MKFLHFRFPLAIPSLCLIRKLRLTDASSNPVLNQYFQIKCNKPGFPGKFIRNPGNLKLNNFPGSRDHETQTLVCAIVIVLRKKTLCLSEAKTLSSSQKPNKRSGLRSCNDCRIIPSPIKFNFFGPKRKLVRFKNSFFIKCKKLEIDKQKIGQWIIIQAWASFFGCDLLN